MNKFDLEMMEDELKTIQKRARVRKIDMQDIDDAIFEIQSLIDGFINPIEILSYDSGGKFIDDMKNGSHGMCFFVNPNAQSFPASYRGDPESTNFYLSITNEGIITVNDIRRERCNSFEYRYLGRKEVNV